MLDDASTLVDHGPVGDDGFPLPAIVAGIVAATPAHTTDLLKVTIGSFDDHAKSWSFSCRWQTRCDANGDYVPPTEGDDCSVHFDNNHAPWVSVYWPS